MKAKLNDLMVVRDLMNSKLDSKNKRFSYALEKNITKVTTIEKHAKNRVYKLPIFADSDDFKKFYTSLQKLIEQHAKRDEAGHKLYDSNDNIITNDVTLYTEALKNLRESEQKGAAIFDRRMEALNTMGETMVDIEFKLLLDEDCIPEDFSTRDRMNFRFMMDSSLIPSELFEEVKEELAESHQVQEDVPEVKTEESVEKKQVKVKIEKKPRTKK